MSARPVGACLQLPAGMDRMGKLKSNRDDARPKVSVEERLAKYRWMRKVLANHPDFPDVKDHLDGMMVATYALEAVAGRMEELQRQLAEAAEQKKKLEHRWDDTFVLLGDYLKLRNEMAARKIMVFDIDFNPAGDLRKAE